MCATIGAEGEKEGEVEVLRREQMLIGEGNEDGRYEPHSQAHCHLQRQVLHGG